MRHESWDRLTRSLDRVVEIYGGSIYDHRCGKTWDPGQAVCAEAYGPEWSNSEQFKRDDAASDEEPVPGVAWEALDRLVNRQSEWAKPTTAQASHAYEQ